jgi:hypothetical protein
MNFGKLCLRFQEKFARHIKDFFMVQLRLQGFDKDFLNRANYTITLNKNNHFEKFKQMEVDTARMDLLNAVADKMISGENFNQNPMFSRKFILKNICGFSDDDLQMNEALLKDEVKEFEKVMEASGGAGGAPQAAPGGMM